MDHVSNYQIESLNFSGTNKKNENKIFVVRKFQLGKKKNQQPGDRGDGFNWKMLHFSIENN